MRRLEHSASLLNWLETPMSEETDYKTDFRTY